jgi:hypothetical protein
LTNGILVDTTWSKTSDVVGGGESSIIVNPLSSQIKGW